MPYLPFHFYLSFRKKDKENIKIETDVVRTNTEPCCLSCINMKTLSKNGYRYFGAK